MLLSVKQSGVMEVSVFTRRFSVHQNQHIFIVNDNTLSRSIKHKYWNTANVVHHNEIGVPVFISAQLANSNCCLCVNELEVFLPNFGYRQLIMSFAGLSETLKYATHDSCLDPK